MELHSDIINNIPILKVEGKIEPHDSPEFIRQLKYLSNDTSPTIILDLHKTTFLDSAAIGIICSIHIERATTGKKLEIMTNSSPGGFINQLFEVTGLDKILHITKAV